MKKMTKILECSKDPSSATLQPGSGWCDHRRDRFKSFQGLLRFAAGQRTVTQVFLCKL